MSVEGERPSDTATKRPRHDEVQRPKLRQFIAYDFTKDDAVEGISHAGGGDLASNVRVVASVVRDDGDVAGVTLVASTPVRDRSELHATVSYCMRHGTEARGMSADSMASTRFTTVEAPPPPAGPLV